MTKTQKPRRLAAVKGTRHAAQERQQPADRQSEHQNRDGSWTAAETGRSHLASHSTSAQEPGSVSPSSQEKVTALLSRFRQLNNTHVGDESNIVTSGALMKETLALLCELVDLPIPVTYTPKAGGPKPQKKPIVRDTIPVIDGVPLR